MNRAHRARIDKKSVVGMAVDIDEAGRDGKAAGVDIRESICLDVADLAHATIVDRYVRANRRRAGSVDNGTISYDEVRLHH
jgi:hypothetical protein